MCIESRKTANAGCRFRLRAITHRHLSFTFSIFHITFPLQFSFHTGVFSNLIAYFIMSEGIKVENNIDVAKFQSVWKVSTSRIAQWQVDQGLVKPKGKSPEEDATYRAYRNKKRSNKIGKIAEALENTTRDPETFSRLERKAAIDHYPHIFEEVVSTPRYAKIKRRETPPCGTW